MRSARRPAIINPRARSAQYSTFFARVGASMSRNPAADLSADIAKPITRWVAALGCRQRLATPAVHSPERCVRQWRPSGHALPVEHLADNIGDSTFQGMFDWRLRAATTWRTISDSNAIEAASSYTCASDASSAHRSCL